MCYTIFSVGDAVRIRSSYDEFHTLGANVAMVALLANIGVLLFLHDQWFWLAIHLVTPATLAFGALASGYGVWQKGVIL